jgi:hypothetical protein
MRFAAFISYSHADEQLEPAKRGATITWEEYYEAVDLDMTKANFDDALADAAANLVRLFGGEIIERHVEK